MEPRLNLWSHTVHIGQQIIEVLINANKSVTQRR